MSTGKARAADSGPLLNKDFSYPAKTVLSISVTFHSGSNNSDLHNVELEFTVYL